MSEPLRAGLAVRILGEAHRVATLHRWDVPEHRGTNCRSCDALATLDRPGLDVEQLARADWEVFGGARASGSTWDDLDERTRERTLYYAREVAAEYDRLADAQQREGAGESRSVQRRKAVMRGEPMSQDQQREGAGE